MPALENLFHRYHIPLDPEELKKACTHSSYSPDNQSRYAFLGQFAFKGLVAQYIATRIAGSGTQLQHYLGNIFSAERLVYYFHDWDIDASRMDETVPYGSQKHIFVFAILGYIISHASPESVQEFIRREFILPNDHLLPRNHAPKNTWAQLKFLTKQHLGATAKLRARTEDGIQHVSVAVLGLVIGEGSSVSYRYARTKAITMGLRHVAEKAAENNRPNPEFIRQETLARVQADEELRLQKEEKQQQHRARIEAHAQRMAVRRKAKAAAAKEEDKRRLEAKKNTKEEKKSRKGADTIYREYTRDEVAAMSAAKRRNLQDKGIIPKGNWW